MSAEHCRRLKPGLAKSGRASCLCEVVWGLLGIQLQNALAEALRDLASFASADCAYRTQQQAPESPGSELRLTCRHQRRTQSTRPATSFGYGVLVLPVRCKDKGRRF